MANGLAPVVAFSVTFFMEDPAVAISLTPTGKSGPGVRGMTQSNTFPTGRARSVRSLSPQSEFLRWRLGFRSGRATQ